MRLRAAFVSVFCVVLSLTACADIGQSLAKMNIAAMDADDYFQSDADVALVETASRGDAQGIQKAIANGANVDAVGKNGMTPLFWVIAIDPSLDGLQALLDNGADPNIKTIVSGEIRDNETYATDLAYRRPDPRYMEILLDAGAEARPDLLNEPLRDDHLAHLKLLIAHGADVNHRYRFGTTPIYHAITGKDFKAALLFLNTGADPRVKNANGNSALTPLRKLKPIYTRELDNPQSGYAELIQALKQKGYLEPDF